MTRPWAPFGEAFRVRYQVTTHRETQTWPRLPDRSLRGMPRRPRAGVVDKRQGHAGAPGRNRTCCLSVRSRTLCPVSYRRVAGFPVYLPRYTAPSVNRLTAALAITFALVACTSPLTSAPPPSPLPSATPHNPVTSALLKPSDLPAPLTLCQGSGPIAGYIATIKSANPDLAQRLTKQWNDLKNLGATEAAINLFAADPSACTIRRESRGARAPAWVRRHGPTTGRRFASRAGRRMFSWPWWYSQIWTRQLSRPGRPPSMLD